MLTSRPILSIDDYINGIKSNQLHLLARAITLIESRKSTDEKIAQQVLEQVIQRSGNSLRLGISGVPGVGKSTFIEAFGLLLCNMGYKVAVLTVDPSSIRTGGSILGDKTRMIELGSHPNAYIRPSPTAGTLGGVARRTRETILLCEASGYDLIIVETVGVGQSEISVAGMVDLFMLLMLPGAGDELQGIKKGIIEIADMVVVNKADGTHVNKARIAAKEYAQALQIIAPQNNVWSPPVLTCSALERKGLQDIWEEVLRFQKTMSDNKLFSEKREKQQLNWMWEQIENELISAIKSDALVNSELAQIEDKVVSGELPVRSAVSRVLENFWHHNADLNR